MDPTTAGAVGVQVAGGLLQYLNSQEARATNAADLQKIQDLYAKIQQPNFDVSSITPQDYQVVQKYAPQAAPMVSEAAPQVVQNNAQMTQAQQAQTNALQQLQARANTSIDPSLQTKLNLAGQQANANANSNIQNILSSQQRRGLLGSGQQLAGQMQASTGAMNNEAQAGAQASLASQQAQLQALRDAASLGGQINSQQMSQQDRNASIINAYNQRQQQNQQNWNNQNANLQNNAQMQNINAAQNVANLNTQQKNQANVYNRNYANQMGQQGFQNSYTQAAPMASSYYAQGQNAMGGAADKNQAIGGVTGALSSGAMYYNSQNRADARNKTMADAISGGSADDEE